MNQYQGVSSFDVAMQGSSVHCPAQDCLWDMQETADADYWVFYYKEGTEVQCDVKEGQNLLHLAYYRSLLFCVFTRTSGVSRMDFP